MKYAFSTYTIEAAFRRVIDGEVKRGVKFTAQKALELVIDFYGDILLEGVDYDIPDNDMLLFQYGIYDWQDGNGENFSVDITRQFLLDNNEEAYQLRFTLFYPTNQIGRDIKGQSLWSIDSPNIKEWYSKINMTEGFIKAADYIPQSYTIRFGTT